MYTDVKFYLITNATKTCICNMYLMQIRVAGLTPSQKYYQSVGMFSLDWPNTLDKAEINMKITRMRNCVEKYMYRYYQQKIHEWTKT